MGNAAESARTDERRARSRLTGAPAEVFEQLLDATPDALVGVDSDGRIVYANAQAVELFRYARGELLGRSIEELVPERFRDLHIAHRAGYHADPRTRPMGIGIELYARRRDGSEFPAEISLSSIDVDGERMAIAAIRDVADRRRVEQELRRSNAELDRFASLASHDLAQPLRVIAGFAEILRRRYSGKLDDSADEMLDHLESAARHGLDLVDAMLGYARLSTSEFDLQPVDSSESVQTALLLLHSLIEERGAEVEVGPMPQVHADPTHLARVFQNLIGNAIKFNESDPPRVRIGADPAFDGWRISVEDNGIGIDPGQAERAFRIFQRLHSAGRYDGTGMGLAVCRSIIERHGGRIWIEPLPGGGTAVRFSLPAADPRALAGAGDGRGAGA